MARDLRTEGKNGQEITEADKALLKKMGDVRPLCFTVVINVKNGVPSNYNVTIIEIGANFYYRDNSVETKGPFPVNIGSNDSRTIQSDCTEKCCNRTFTALKVQQAGYEPVPVTHWHDATAENCLAYHDVELIINSEVSPRVMASNTEPGAIGHLLAIRARN